MTRRFYSLGLIGYPLGHSLSPYLHQAAFQSVDLHGVYDLYPVQPSDQAAVDLVNLLQRLRQGELQGLNVTIPHKRTILSFLDAITSAARAIGAANTLWLQDRQIIGDNTDAAGFWADLNLILPPGLGAHSRNSALILGAGGAARAVAYILALEGWRVWVASRRIAQAQELVRDICLGLAGIGFISSELQLQAIALESEAIALFPSPQVIINATSIGMYPAIDASPWPASVLLPQGAIVYDLVYNPVETALVKSARDQGLSAVTGLGMLVEQAALAFERWTGHTPSRKAMGEAAMHAFHVTKKE